MSARAALYRVRSGVPFWRTAAVAGRDNARPHGAFDRY